MFPAACRGAKDKIYDRLMGESRQQQGERSCGLLPISAHRFVAVGFAHP